MAGAAGATGDASSDFDRSRSTERSSAGLPGIGQHRRAPGTCRWRQNGVRTNPFRLPQAATTPGDATIKNAPDDVVARLRLRAERNHRSLQGELLAIITAAASEPELLRLDALGVLANVRAKLRPSPNEAAAIVRQMRDERANRRR